MKSISALNIYLMNDHYCINDSFYFIKSNDNYRKETNRALHNWFFKTLSFPKA